MPELSTACMQNNAKSVGGREAYLQVTTTLRLTVVHFCKERGKLMLLQSKLQSMCLNGKERHSIVVQH